MSGMRIIVALAVMLAVSPTFAAPPQKATMTPQQFVDKVVAWATTDAQADLTAAIAIADAANDTVSKPCWTSIQIFVTAIQKLNSSTPLPTTHLAVDVEIMTDVAFLLQPNSPVVTACAALANSQRMGVINVVTAIVTGAASISKVAPVIPDIL